MHHPAITPFRGRRAELAVLDELLGELEKGRGGTILFEGDPGSGKSRLLDEVGARTSARCFRGTGVPDGYAGAYAPLLEALLTGPDPVLDASTLRPMTAPDQRFWLLQEVQERLELAAREAPLVVTVDDVQWCDPATLNALETLPGRLADHPVLWVLASRPPSPLRSPRTIRLEPLDAGAVAEIATDVLRSDVDPSVLELAGRTEGRPLLLVELLRGMVEEGSIVVRDGTARLTAEHPIPLRFRASIQRRLDQLSPATRHSVQVASVLGRTFTADQLAALIAARPTDLIETLDEAIAADFLVDTGVALAFRHDLIREAIGATLPATVRDALRRQAVDIHLEHGGSAVEIAAELAATATPGDRRAIALLREAAVQLTATAPTRAAVLSERALAISGPDGPDTPVLVGETVLLLWQAGRAADAMALADSALDGLLPPEEEARLRLSVARVCGQYSWTEAVRQAGIGAALPGVSAELRARLLAVQAMCLSMYGDTPETIRVTGVALAAARESGDLAAEATALFMDSVVHSFHDEWGTALEIQDRAEALAAEAGVSRSAWVQEGSWTSLVRSAIGDTDAALRVNAEGLRHAERHGHAGALCLWTMNRSRILLDAGRLADARAECEAALAMSEDLGTGMLDATVRYALGVIAVRTGDEEGIRQGLADAERMMGSEASHIRRIGAWMAAQAADAAGDPRRAVELTADGRAAFAEPVPSLVNPGDLADELVYARIALRAGDRVAAEAAIAVTTRRAELNPGLPFLAAIAGHGRALLAGNADELRTSAERLGAFDRPIVHAAALEDAAGADRAAAPALLAAAEERYAAAGATADAARVRARLGNRAPRAAAVRPDHGWDALTESELRVVDLVVAGATNRQVAERLVLSPHTVNNHLRHVYTKLGVSSRAELAKIAATARTRE